MSSFKQALNILKIDRLNSGSMLLVFSGVFTFLVDAYPVYAASALAANSFARSSFAAAFPLFGDQSELSPPVIGAVHSCNIA